MREILQEEAKELKENWELNFTTARLIVEGMLKQFEEARNDDEFLIRLVKIINSKIKSETITRARRIIQNVEGKYLPTMPAIMVRRHLKEEMVRAYFGAKSKEYQWFYEIKYSIKC